MRAPWGLDWPLCLWWLCRSWQLAKLRVARSLDSRALQADSTQTTLCTYLSAFLLVGLATNSLLGWWADPLAGIAIAAFAA